MYDLARFNSIAELEELIMDLNAVLSSKKVDPAVRKECQDTKHKAVRKINEMKKHNGL